jgi:hypothetical protein
VSGGVHRVTTSSTARRSASARQRDPGAGAAAPFNGSVDPSHAPSGDASSRPRTRSRVTADARGLLEELHTELRPGLDVNIQTELAHLARVLPNVGRVEDARIVGQVSHVLEEVSVAFSALLADPPNLRLGTMIRKDVCWRLHPLNVLLARMLFPGESPATWLALGLVIIGILGIPGTALGYRLLLGVPALKVSGLDPNTLMIVAIAGGLGAIVSVASRLLNVTKQAAGRPNEMFWTGLFKPLVGTIFALFVFMLLNSGLVPVQQIDAKKQVFFFAAVGFIAGFSERFAPDLADVGAKRLRQKA